MLSAGILSAGILAFSNADAEDDSENVDERLQELIQKYTGLRENFLEYKDYVSEELDNFDFLRKELARLENRLVDLENQLYKDELESAVYEFSFENGMQEWRPEGTDLDNPPIEWSIERSQELSLNGSSSLQYMLANNNDAGKIWIERSFDVRPERKYRVGVSYDLASMDYGVNLWTIITGAYPKEPLKESKSNLIFQGDTGTGDSPTENFKWLKKSYDFVVEPENGEIFVNIGVWGTWETTRYYYLDNVKVEIEPISDKGETNSGAGVDFESKVFDHSPGIEKPMVENGLSADGENLVSMNFLDLLTSKEDLKFFDFSSIPQDSEDFINSTNFDRSYLFVFQEFPDSSVPDYDLKGASRVGDTVNLFMDDSSTAGTTDITVETVLVRLGHKEDSLRNIKVVTEDGEVFRVGAERDPATVKSGA